MKKMTLKVALLAAVMVAVPGVALADFDSARKAAVAEVDKAKKVGGEWRDTRWKKSKRVTIKVDGKKKKMSFLAAADHYNKAGEDRKSVV